MLPLLLAILATFPAPCSDATICWMAWDSVTNADRVEVVSGGIVCDTLPTPVGYRKPQSPSSVWWPHDTSSCPLNENITRWYNVRACNAFGCSSESVAIEFIGQKQAALFATSDGRGCEKGTQYTTLGRCPG